MRRECARVEESIRRAIAGSDPNDLEAVIRQVVRAVIDAFGGQRRARRFLVLRMARLGRGQAATTALDTIGRATVQALVASEGYRVTPMSDAATFVLTRTLAGTVHAAVLEESRLLATRAFEDELVHLTLRFVRP